MSFELPELDRKATQKAVEEALSKYRLYKYLSFEERETSITANYEVSEGGKGNKISDQTSSVAIYNVDQQNFRKQFCERIEKAVNRLPRMERFLIEERYMTNESEYITDYNVYSFKFNPPITAKTYAKIRWRAFYRLALNLNLAVIKQSGNEYKCDNGGEER